MGDIENCLSRGGGRGGDSCEPPRYYLHGQGCQCSLSQNIQLFVFHTKCDLTGSDRGHLKHGVLRFFCWINQLVHQSKPLSAGCSNRARRTWTRSSSSLPLSLSLWGRVCPPRHRRNHRSLALSLDAGRARAAKLSENEAPSRSSSFVLSSLVAWVSRFAASSVVILLCD